MAPCGKGSPWPQRSSFGTPPAAAMAVRIARAVLMSLLVLVLVLADFLGWPEPRFHAVNDDDDDDDDDDDNDALLVLVLVLVLLSSCS